MKKSILTTFLLFLTHILTAQQSLLLDSTLLDVTIAIDSVRLHAPWDIDWGFDGRLWMTDAKEIRAWDPATNSLKTLFKFPQGNGLGLAVPKTAGPAPIYVYAVFDTAAYYSSGYDARLYRFTYNAANDTLENDTLLLSYFHAGEHSGGRLIIGPGGKIFLSTADYWYGTDTLGFNKGKILRFNPDGSVPVDNPRADHTWTYGHRNPQGMVMLPDSTIYISEHGQNLNEINRIIKGKNYGWPAFDANICFGVVPDSCISPTFLANYMPPDIDPGFPPGGIDYYNHDAIPEFKNALIGGALRSGNEIVSVKLNAAHDSVLYKNNITTLFKRTRDICVIPDGSIYLIAGDRDGIYVSGDTLDSHAMILHLKNPFYNPAGLQALTPQAIRVYPNPCATYINILTGNIQAGAQEYEIHNYAGAIVKKGQIKANNTRVDIADIPAGFYLVTLSVDGHVTGRTSLVVIH